jgi:acyl-CoA dehydrogenase
MNPVDPAETELMLEQVRRFAQTEVAPHLEEWEAAGEFPRSMYKRWADLGWLAMGYPEELGGIAAPWTLRNAFGVAAARYTASGGLLASLGSNSIGLPPIINYGSAALKQAIVPPVLAGDKIAALGITEPGGGSDVANLRTTARREGDYYIINGEKTFITSGMRFDWISLAVRTDADNKGAGGISMIAVPGDAPGLSRTKLHKMGWHCSDTASLHFDNVRVPVGNLLGEEHKGFKIIMGNFNGERLGMSATAIGMAEACYDEALAWARERKTFGQPLTSHQVLRHKLVDMRMRIEASRAWLDKLSVQADAGQTGQAWVAEVCMLKNQSTQTMQFCADQGVQILGGMGYMRGSACERIYREVKVMTIGGGAEEIMKELAARQLDI